MVRTRAARSLALPPPHQGGASPRPPTQPARRGRPGSRPPGAVPRGTPEACSLSCPASGADGGPDLGSHRAPSAPPEVGTAGSRDRESGGAPPPTPPGLEHARIGADSWPCVLRGSSAGVLLAWSGSLLGVAAHQRRRTYPLALLAPATSATADALPSRLPADRPPRRGPGRRLAAFGRRASVGPVADPGRVTTCSIAGRHPADATPRVGAPGRGPARFPSPGRGGRPARQTPRVHGHTGRLSSFRVIAAVEARVPPRPSEAAPGATDEPGRRPHRCAGGELGPRRRHGPRATDLAPQDAPPRDPVHPPQVAPSVSHTVGRPGESRPLTKN